MISWTPSNFHIFFLITHECWSTSIDKSESESAWSCPDKFKSHLRFRVSSLWNCYGSLRSSSTREIVIKNKRFSSFVNWRVKLQICRRLKSTQLLQLLSCFAGYFWKLSKYFQYRRWKYSRRLTWYYYMSLKLFLMIRLDDSYRYDLTIHATHVLKTKIVRCVT